MVRPASRSPAVHKKSRIWRTFHAPSSDWPRANCHDLPAIAHEKLCASDGTFVAL